MNVGGTYSCSHDSGRELIVGFVDRRPEGLVRSFEDPASGPAYSISLELCGGSMFKIDDFDALRHRASRIAVGRLPVTAVRRSPRSAAGTGRASIK